MSSVPIRSILVKRKKKKKGSKNAPIRIKDYNNAGFRKIETQSL